MDEKEIWKEANKRTKKELEKKRKWLNYLTDKLIDTEIKLSYANAIIKSDGAFLARMKYQGGYLNKLKHMIENDLGQERNKFWETYEKQVAELEKMRIQYKNMFTSGKGGVGIDLEKRLNNYYKYKGLDPKQKVDWNLVKKIRKQ